MKNQRTFTATKLIASCSSLVQSCIILKGCHIELYSINQSINQSIITAFFHIKTRACMFFFYPFSSLLLFLSFYFHVLYEDRKDDIEGGELILNAHFRQDILNMHAILFPCRRHDFTCRIYRRPASLKIMFRKWFFSFHTIYPNY